METRQKNQLETQNRPDENDDDEKRKKKKRTEKMQRYRSNVKSDVKRLEEMRKKDRERKKAKRLDQKQAILKGNKKLENKLKQQRNQHMQKYRAKKKEAKKRENEQNSSSEKTSNELNHVNQELKRDKQKEATRRWRMKIKLSSPESKTETLPASSSRSTWYRRTKKVKDILPKTPIKKAAVLEKLLDSPTTSNILAQKGIIVGKATRKKLELADSVLDTMKNDISSLKPKGSMKVGQKVKYTTLVQTAAKAIGKKYHMRKLLGIGKKHVRHRKGKQWTTIEELQKRKKRKDRISDDVRHRVENFFLSPEISREVPNKKDVLKVKEGTSTEFIQKHLMSVTVVDAYSRYKAKYPNDKIGLTTFRRLKPTQVRQITETNRRSCLCQKCCNVALKAEALKKFATQMDMKDVTIDKTELADATLCPKQENGFHKSSCLERTCRNCGVDNLENQFATLIEKSSSQEKKIQYHKWEYITIQKDDDTTKRIISCVSKCTSFKDFLNELKSDLTDYSYHKFRASWQQQQMGKCIQQLNPNEILMVMDFAENYKCSFQNEVQGAFFDQNLVTIHPCMVYYRQSIDGKELQVKHSIIGISNDLKHDAHLVKTFETKILDIIKEQMPNIDCIIQFTDGCAAQYKGKNSFGYLSRSEIPTTRNFFETSHGKNVCDGLGAIVKTSCYRAMLSGKVIANPENVYQHCQDVLTRNMTVNEKDNTITKREFIFVDRNEIDRKDICNVKTLVGTRKIHSVRSTGCEFVVESRNLSCFCKGCTTSEDCEMSQYVNNWSLANLKSTEIAGNSKIETVKTAQNKKSKKSGDRTANVLVANELTLKEKVLALQENSYVQIEIQVGKTKRTKTYVAKVVEVDKESEELCVCFMEEKHGCYIWPDDEQLYWEKAVSVTKILSQPRFSTQSTNKRPLYTFD